MNSEEYQRAAARTDLTDEEYSGAGGRVRLHHLMLLQSRLADLARLDDMKREVCYGKPTDVERLSARNEEIISVDFSKLSPQAFHYLLGMMAEIPEVALALVRGDNVEAAGELGDLEWFRTRLASHIGASLTDIHAGNIAKLKARHPERFSDDDPSARDLEAERAALEGAAEPIPGWDIACSIKEFLESKRVAQLARVQSEALELFRRKNADYGDSFASHGIVGVLVRLHDKILRALSISKSGVQRVNDEGLRDTLVDLHNYAGMAVMLMDEECDASNQ